MPSAEIGQELPQDDLEPPHRRREELLHGAPFPLPGDGEGGEQHRPDGQEVGGEPRDEEDGRARLRVVAGPGAHLERRRRRSPELRREAERLGAGDGLRLLQDLVGGGGVRAVDEELRPSRLPAGEVPPVARAHDQHRLGRAAPEEPLRLLGRHHARDGELARAGEGVGEGARGRRPVAVRDGQRDAVQIERDAVAEEEQEQDRHDERQVERARVALDVQHLLARHGGDPQEEAAQALRHVAAPAGAAIGRPTTARNTSSSDGAPSSTRTSAAPAARERARHAGGVERARLDPHVQAGAERLHPEHPGAPAQGSRGREESPAAGEEDLPRHPGRLERRGRVERHQTPVDHEADPPTVLGLVQVVRGDEDGRALRRERADEPPEAAPRQGVDPGGRLVEEDHLRPVQDGAGEREALADAARQRAGRRRRPARRAR